MTTSYDEHVLAYLAQQRWFGGKDRPSAVAGSARLGWLSPPGEVPAVRMELIHVSGDDRGGSETYQLPLAYYPEPQERLGHAFVGEWDDPELGPVVAYDAVHDRTATLWWLRGLAEERDTGDLAFRVLSGAELPPEVPSLVLSGEQSNTSLVFGEEAVLKVFRRVAVGHNPDIEIHDALTRAGSTQIAPLLGWVEGRWRNSEGQECRGDLAMLQRFLRTATNGWESALTSVRDLFAEGDLHADEVGGDFAAEAHRLGAATAEIHQELAHHFPTGEWSAPDLRRLAEVMGRRLDLARALVPQLDEHAPVLREAYARLESLTGVVPAQRVHGDLHLGQTMRTVTGWTLIDFEGEPARPLAERTALDSPIRDVAGMLRSFDYAAHVLVGDHAAHQQIAYRAVEWATRNRSAFCDGYAEVSTNLRAEPTLLQAYEADKAVYEVAYEKRNRPSWVHLPLDAIGRMVAGWAGNGR